MSVGFDSVVDGGVAVAEMSDEHKAALSVGRKNAGIVRRYLEAKETQKPRKGRKRTPESINKQLASIEEQLGEASALKRVELIQRRFDLQDALADLEAAESVDISALEAEFVEVVAAYSETKGIGYRTWREVGVDAEVLRRGGVKETRKRA